MEQQSVSNKNSISQNSSLKPIKYVNRQDSNNTTKTHVLAFQGLETTQSLYEPGSQEDIVLDENGNYVVMEYSDVCSLKDLNSVQKIDSFQEAPQTEKLPNIPTYKKTHSLNVNSQIFQEQTNLTKQSSVHMVHQSDMLEKKRCEIPKEQSINKNLF